MTIDFSVYISELLLETMMGADLKTCQEALIYCIGALKFLTGNATIAKQLVHKDCIEKLSVLLSSINKHVSDFIFSSTGHRSAGLCHAPVSVVRLSCAFTFILYIFSETVYPILIKFHGNVPFHGLP